MQKQELPVFNFVDNSNKLQNIFKKCMEEQLDYNIEIVLFINKFPSIAWVDKTLWYRIACNQLSPKYKSRVQFVKWNLLQKYKSGI